MGGLCCGGKHLCACCVDEAYDREHQITLPALLEQARTGDIILFDRRSGTLDCCHKWCTGSVFVHCGIVLEVPLREQGGPLRKYTAALLTASLCCCCCLQVSRYANTLLHWLSFPLLLLLPASKPLHLEWATLHYCTAYYVICC